MVESQTQPSDKSAQAVDDFPARNATFVDRVIQRWEVVMEHRIRLRHGGIDALEDPETEATVHATLRGLDEEIAELRGQAEAAGRSLPLDQITAAYDLDPLEEAVLELALMPLLEISFRNRLARYHNNILFDFVDADLALHLLLPSREERLRARQVFASDGRLLRHRLLTQVAPKDPRGAGVLGLELMPPERLADFVLGRRVLDHALRPYARLAMPRATFDDVVLPEGVAEELLALSGQLAGDGAPFPVGKGLTLEFCGPPGTGKSLLAEALSHELGRPMIVVDCAALNMAAGGFVDLLDGLFTEARVQGAVLVLDRPEPLLQKGNPRLPSVLKELDRFGGLTLLTTQAADDLDPSVERYVAWQLMLAMPNAADRQRIWEALLPEEVQLADDVDLEDLGTRFEIVGGQVANAWAVAARRARSKRGGKGKTTVDQAALKEAAQAQIRANMEDYSIRSAVTLTLDDLVLPDKEMTLIREVLEACQNRVFVMSKWGFGRRLVTGKGLCILFKGEPGTGKTLCAEIMASELDMKLYQISIPKVVSKYIGETEKNISRIFSSARANHCMLLFDEADALFTKRVAVENAVDRFSNMETNLLLQEIERFEGITILTTNLDKNMDDAFARRIQFKIDFPFPDAEHRSLIWKSLLPMECPVDEGIDFEDVGQSFELSGGHIKNAVVRAAYRAAGRGDQITAEDIEFAAEQECKNAGKLFRSSSSDDEW